VDRELRAQELARIQAELRTTTEALARTEDEARRLEADVLRQQPQVAARLVELYKLGRAGYWRLLLHVDDIRGFGRAYRSVSTLARLDQDRVTAHRLTLASLTAARATLQTRRVAMRALETDAQAARLALERALAAYERRLGDLDTRRDLNAQLTGELEVAQQRLQTTLGSIVAAAAGAAALPIAPFRGSLDWPVDGTLVVPFGREARTRFGTGVRHNGIEIAAGEGTPVLAVHDGSVAFADLFTGYGHLVILDHGDQAYSLYGHLASLDVQRGMTVGRGAVLGAIGRPPGGDAPRLYFELRIDARPVDPVEWFRKR
jgi:septal ring factor EnvC (AmiA/AmiB activator)